MNTLFPHQQKALDFLETKRGKACMLCLPCRAGKTPVTLKHLKGQPVIVVCPKSAIGVWKAHCKEWAPEYSVLPSKRFCWPKQGEILILNYEQIKPSGWPAEGTVLVADEMQLVRNPKAGKSKRLALVKEAIKCHGGYAIGLSATPIYNSPEDLWNLLLFFGLNVTAFYMDDDPSIKTSRERFLQSFNAYYHPLLRKIIWGSPTYQARQFLGRVMLIQNKEEIFKDLPRVSFENIPIELEEGRTSELCNKFQGMLSAAGLKPPDILQAHRHIPTATIFAMRKEVARYKSLYLLEHLDTLAEDNSRVVVFSSHREPIELLAKRSGWAIITGDTPEERRTQICLDFREGRLLGVGATTACAQAAIDLSGADYMIFVDLPWTPAACCQAAARCQGPRMTKPLCIQTLILNHIVDQTVNEILLIKMHQTTGLFE